MWLLRSGSSRCLLTKSFQVLDSAVPPPLFEDYSILCKNGSSCAVSNGGPSFRWSQVREGLSFFSVFLYVVQRSFLHFRTFVGKFLGTWEIKLIRTEKRNVLKVGLMILEHINIILNAWIPLFIVQIGQPRPKRNIGLQHCHDKQMSALH